MLAVFHLIDRSMPFRYRRTVGDGARLAAALGTPEIAEPRQAWTREASSIAIDRLIMKTLKIEDFTDACLPVERPLFCPRFLE